MNIRGQLILLIGLSLTATPLSAQYFGGSPPAVRWKQLNTDTVRLIFPDTWKGDVHRLASLAAALGSTQQTLGNRFRKFDIVLQNQTTVSNAYVGLGPRRSEFLMTPLQNSFHLGSLPWPDQLMLHEFRHVQQYNNFNQGLSRFFYFLSGQLGLTLMNNAAVPNWFWEGDAVDQETRQSTQGRGRLPYFFNGYRSLWAAGKNYSWMKLRSGSLRDYVPDHYQLGYLLTAYGRERWGAEAWKHITADAVRFRSLLYPFQAAVRRHTGMGYTQFCREALEYFKQELAAAPDSFSRFAAQQKHFAGDEAFPQWVGPHQLVLQKSSYSLIPGFYLRDLVSGKDRLIRVRDLSLDAYFSCRRGKIVYAATGFDRRWDWRDYSDIRLIDLSTGIQQNITFRSKYFSPDISDDGRQIVAVAQGPDGQSLLTLLETQSGQIIRQWPNTERLYYTHPKFMGNRYVVTPVRNQQGEMALLQLDITTDAVTTMLPFTPAVMGFPQVQGDTLSITLSYGRQDQLFLMVNNTLFRIQPRQVNNHTGSYQLHVSQGQMAWSVFTAAGSRVVTEALNPEQLTQMPLESLRRPLPDFGVRSLGQAAVTAGATEVPRYPITSYPKSYRLLNLHSWLPVISDPEYQWLLLSENVLNTLRGEMALTYNTNERSKKISVLAVYGGWFPWLRLGGGYTWDRRAFYRENPVYWNEAELRAGVQLPLNLSGGRHWSYLRVGSDYVYTRPQFRGAYKDSFDYNGYGYLNNFLVFTRQVQQARQHIYPHWAQQLRLEYNRAITRLEANQALANGYVYLPGWGRNHSLVLNVAAQRRDTLRQLSFSSSFPFSRGYVARNFHQMIKWGLNYHFPLAYPDWGFGNLWYLLRIRANIYYDVTRVRDYAPSRQLLTRDYRSLGAEVFLDTRFWNQVPISFGLRYARLLDASLQGLAPNQWEFVLPLTLINR